MPSVYVVGAIGNTGGDFMAYHLGRIISLNYGYNFINVCDRLERRPIFKYDVIPETVSFKEMEKNIKAEDVFIANAYYSFHLFGYRLPCKKIMYVQGFQTFSALDCKFDYYISASGLIQRFLKAIYDIETKVINPFIQIKRLPPSLPWQMRAAQTILVYKKDDSYQYNIILDYLKSYLEKQSYNIALSNVHSGRTLPHLELMKKISENRFFLNLCPAEGFGLVALEAMAMETTVIGLDGIAGRDYMRSRFNCLCGSITNLDNVAELIITALENDDLAYRIAIEAKKTAQNFKYEIFKKKWIEELNNILDHRPVNA